MLNPNYTTCPQSQVDFTLAPKSLENKIILITGATGGMGTALSKACAQASATVILASRKLKKLEKLYDVVRECSSSEPAMITLEQDKAGPAEYAELADMLEKEFGKIDAVVHTAADLGTPTPHMAIEHAEWIRLMNVNLTSARLLSLYCIPLLSQSEIGSITFSLDHKPTAYWGTYGVSKQAVQSFMHMLADEHDGKLDSNGHPLIAINGFDPGPMRTPLRRRAFPGELEEETMPPELKLGPLLSLMSREDRTLTSAAMQWPTH
jgi:NAD(P)-dependent dehydrogenase (short-subunit alcohol dehydrogenase family)